MRTIGASLTISGRVPTTTATWASVYFSSIKHPWWEVAEWAIINSRENRIARPKEILLLGNLPAWRHLFI
jgi:hypothetical protein